MQVICRHGGGEYLTDVEIRANEGDFKYKGGL